MWVFSHLYGHCSIQNQGIRIILKASNLQGADTNNASCFYFTLLTADHGEISQNFTMTLLKAHLVFKVISIFVNSLLPPLNKSMYFCLVKVALPSLQGFLIDIIVSLQAFFSPHRNKQVTIWRCEVRIVQWIWQTVHSKLVMASVLRTLVCDLALPCQLQILCFGTNSMKASIQTS